MGISPSYIITRFAKSIFTGPVRPTPGTAAAYAGKQAPDAKYGFNLDSFLEAQNLARPSNPPIQIDIKNLARMKSDGIEDSLTLVGVNPGAITDGGSQPKFTSIEVMGRSSPYAYYGGGGARTVSVDIRIHRELFAYYQPFGKKAVSTLNYVSKRLKAAGKVSNYYNNEGKDEPDAKEYQGSYLAEVYAESQARMNEEILECFRNTINWFRALQYPIYGNGGVIAPKVSMKIGSFLSIIGYPSVSVTYDNIFSENYPVSASVKVSITEALAKAVEQTMIYNNSGESAGMDIVEWPSK